MWNWVRTVLVLASSRSRSRSRPRFYAAIVAAKSTRPAVLSVHPLFVPEIQLEARDMSRLLSHLRSNKVTFDNTVLLSARSTTVSFKMCPCRGSSSTSTPNMPTYRTSKYCRVSVLFTCSLPCLSQAVKLDEQAKTRPHTTNH